MMASPAVDEKGVLRSISPQKGFERMDELAWLQAAHRFEQLGETASAQEADVLRKHGKQAARQKSSDQLGMMPAFFEGASDDGKAAGDILRDLFGMATWIETMWVIPNGREPRAATGS